MNLQAKQVNLFFIIAVCEIYLILNALYVQEITINIFYRSIV
jgi:hypothetical protein